MNAPAEKKETSLKATPETPAPEAAAANTEAPPQDKKSVSERAAAARESLKRAASRTKSWSAEHLEPQRHDGLFVVRYFERVIEKIRSTMSATPADTVLDRLTHYGNLAAVVAMALALVYGLLGAVRHTMFDPLPRAIAFVLALAALQYAANKFLDAGRTLMDSTPSRLSSPALLNTIALLSSVAAIVFLVGGLLLALQQRNAGIFVAALLPALITYGIAFISLYPDRINVAIESGVSAGEEALGILSYGIKVMVRLIPFVYGVGMIIGVIAMLGACLSRLGPQGHSPLGAQGARILIMTAAFPFAGYLFFVVHQLLLDVLRSILILPGKIGGRNSA